MLVMARISCRVLCRGSHCSARDGTGSETTVEQESQHHPLQIRSSEVQSLSERGPMPHLHFWRQNVLSALDLTLGREAFRKYYSGTTNVRAACRLLRLIYVNDGAAARCSHAPTRVRFTLRAYYTQFRRLTAGASASFSAGFTLRAPRRLGRAGARHGRF